MKVPGPLLGMFEHARSCIPMMGFMMHLLTYVTRQFDPDMNRDTEGNVCRAGFELVRVDNVYVIEAVKAG